MFSVFRWYKLRVLLGELESPGLHLGNHGHCLCPLRPWPDVVRAWFNDQGFREAALIFCGGLTPADFQVAFKRLEEQSRDLEAAQVEAMPGMGGKKPLHATNPAS